MRTAWLAFGLTAVACAGFSFTACGNGDDNSGGSKDSGSDSTAIDGEANETSTESETGTGPDTGTTPETGTGAETGSDGGPNDATTDSPSTMTNEGGACTLFDASGLDEASVTAGFDAVWKVYKCYACHQKSSQTVDDAGNGIVLSGNNNGLGDSGTIFPPNLTNDSTGLGCWTNAEIQNAILDGVGPDGGHFCVMPLFGSALKLPNDGGPKPGTPMDAGTAAEIIDYLRSLAPVVNQVPATMCPMPVTDAAADTGSTQDAGSDAPTGDGSADAADGT